MKAELEQALRAIVQQRSAEQTALWRRNQEAYVAQCVDACANLQSATEVIGLDQSFRQLLDANVDIESSAIAQDGTQYIREVFLGWRVDDYVFRLTSEPTTGMQRADHAWALTCRHDHDGVTVGGRWVWRAIQFWYNTEHSEQSARQFILEYMAQVLMP